MQLSCCRKIEHPKPKNIVPPNLHPGKEGKSLEGPGRHRAGWCSGLRWAAEAELPDDHPPVKANPPLPRVACALGPCSLPLLPYTQKFRELGFAAGRLGTDPHAGQERRVLERSPPVLTTDAAVCVGAGPVARYRHADCSTPQLCVVALGRSPRLGTRVRAGRPDAFQPPTNWGFRSKAVHFNGF